MPAALVCSGFFLRIDARVTIVRSLREHTTPWRSIDSEASDIPSNRRPGEGRDPATFDRNDTLTSRAKALGPGLRRDDERR